MIQVAFQEIESVQIMTQVGFPRNDLNQSVTQEKTSILNRPITRHCDSWDWYDFIRTQLTFRELGVTEWRLVLLKYCFVLFFTYDSSSFLEKWIKSTHGSSVFFRNCLDSTSDSSIFCKYWFESTHDSSGRLFDSNELMNKLWVLSMSASNKGPRSVRIRAGNTALMLGIGYDRTRIIPDWFRARPGRG